jgi:hypothetical protein
MEPLKETGPSSSIYTSIATTMEQFKGNRTQQFDLREYLHNDGTIKKKQDTGFRSIQVSPQRWNNLKETGHSSSQFSRVLSCLMLPETSETELSGILGKVMWAV